MVWSIQLTPWALPPLLAVLVVLRDLAFLWPRRREAGGGALLPLTVVSGAWALLHLLGVVAVGLEGKLLAARLAYVPAALAPLAWAGFVFVFVRSRRTLLRWPMLLAYAASAGTVTLALWGRGLRFLMGRGAALVPADGVAGLELSHGPWWWVHLLVRVSVVIGATVILSAHLARGPGHRLRTLAASAAAVVALAPAVFHLVGSPGTWWRDLSAEGFALASALFCAVLLRGRLLALGPVARTLVMEELRDPVVVLDARGRIVDVNREAERLLGLEPYGEVPLSLGTFWASHRSGPGEAQRLSLETTEPVDGQAIRSFEVTITTLAGSGGEGRAALLLRDVTLRDRYRRKLEAVNAELDRQARTDALTGLANRRHFMERLAAEVERSDRYERPLSLVVLDLDRFKSVNDTHGHGVGDEVLRSAAEALRSVCRDVDVPARTGGEEMALLLPETHLRGARTVAERVRTRIERTVHEGPDGDSFGVTASMGVAMLGAGARSGEELLQRADEALYRAKEKGRNRVVVAS